MAWKNRSRDPFEVVFPESGCPVILETIGIVKGAVHPKAARAYYEFVTSMTSVSQLAGDPYFRLPVRKDIPPELLPGWMRTLEFVTAPLDWNVYLARMEEWLQRWDEQARGQGRNH